MKDYLKQTSNFFKPRGKQRLLAYLLIALAGIIVYANTFGNEFVYDDLALVVKNDYIKSWQHIPSIFTTDLFSGAGESSNFYRPIQALSYTFDYSLWRLTPVGYHLSNLLFHILNACLVFALIDFLLKDKKVSLITSLLFVVHPVHTQAVTYVSGRADLLAAFFFLLSIILFAKHFYYPDRRRVYCYIGSLFAFIFAPLSKEPTLVLPLVLILYLFSFHPAPGKVKTSWSKLVWRVLPFFLLAGLYIALRLSVLNFFGESLTTEGIPLHLRLLTMCKAIFVYLKLLFLPFGLHMERILPKATSFFNPPVLASFVLLIAIWTASIVAYRRFRVIFFGSFWFFLNLLPVSNIVPINAILAEHWLYIPSAGFFVILALGIAKISELKTTISPRLLKRVVFLFFILVLVFYSGLTIRRNTDWRDELTFYQRTLRYAPYSWRVHYNFGNAYFKKGLYEKAMGEYMEAIMLRPDYVKAHYNLGDTYYEKGLYNEAINEFKKAIKLKPDHFKAHCNLGNSYYSIGLFDEAIREYKGALLLEPNSDGIHNNLGLVYEKKGLLNEAIDEYKEAIKSNPDSAKTHNNLGIVYTKKGLYDKAVDEYKEVLRLDQNFSEAHNNLGIIYTKEGLYDKAVDEYKDALKINPDFTDAYNGLGIAYIKKGLRDEALKAWERSLEINTNQPQIREYITRYK
jgi:tetratricopeptide (TPR) repeat protein